MPSNLYLFAYAIGKVLLTTGLGPAMVVMGVWELICRAEQRTKQKAVVIEFPRREVSVLKKKKLKKGDANWSSITMQINDAHFHAEGDNTEVQEKLRQWLDETLKPVRKIGELAQQMLGR